MRLTHTTAFQPPGASKDARALRHDGHVSYKPDASPQACSQNYYLEYAVGKMSLKQAWVLAKQAATAWVDDQAPSMGAALSYYTVFSLAPMLLIVLAVAGLVFGQDAARGALFGQLSGMMGADGANAVEGLLASVSKPSEGILATITGLLVLLLGATTVFGELQDALDRIWRAPDRKTGGGLWNLLRTRFLSFGMILGIAFLLMVSLVVSTGVSALGKWWSPMFGGCQDCRWL